MLRVRPLLGRPWTFVRAVALCAVSCVLVHAAWAGDVATRAQDVIDALRGGDVTAAVAVLADDAVAGDLSTRPDLVHVVCDRALRCDEALRLAPEETARALSSALLGIARRANVRAPESVAGLWALSHALVLAERTGPTQGADVWSRAADLLERAHSLEPGQGEAFAYAVTFLMEGAVRDPDQEHALMKRAAALARSAARSHSGAVPLAVGSAGAHLWAARELLERDRKSSKAALQMVFALLEPLLDRDAPTGDVPALWNNAVTFDTAAKFALRERYVTVAAKALDGAIVFDVPVSPRWTVTQVPATEETAAYVYVSETDAAGATLRQVLFRSYRWGYSYPFVGPNEVKGDNVKNIARGLCDLSAVRVFGPGAERQDVRKARMGRDFVGQSFRVAGTTSGEKPAPLTLHGYCVRGSRQVTFGFLVYCYGADGEIDAETQAVLDSLRESED